MLRDSDAPFASLVAPDIDSDAADQIEFAPLIVFG
jgi:hypothetical protein